MGNQPNGLRVVAARRSDTRREAERELIMSEPVDNPGRETVEVRQGTGPRATVSVLFVSLVAAAIAGVILVGYFVFKS